MQFHILLHQVIFLYYNYPQASFDSMNNQFLSYTARLYSLEAVVLISTSMGSLWGQGNGDIEHIL